MDGCAPDSGAGDGDGGGDGDGDGDLCFTDCGDGDGGDGDGDINLGGGSGDGDIAPAENCGDGVLNDDEACDDGNEMGGDGCAASCLSLEPGFTCSKPNQPCQPFAKCGDGVVRFPESCDDENTTPGDGCSANCKEEIGWRCDGSPSTCAKTTCGDGLQEGAEACEHHPSTLVQGQALPFSSNRCTVDTCQKEPDCRGDSCISACGDGLRINEACDDGNTLDGDGCSSTCEVEDGYLCKSAPCEKYDPDGDGEGECMLRVPAIFRDFAGSGGSKWVDVDPNNCGETAGIASSTLTNGKPTFTGVSAGDCVQSASSFLDWYRTSANSSTIVGEVRLFDNGGGGFVNMYGTNGDGLSPTKYDGQEGNPTFFPLDGHELAFTTETYQAVIPPAYGGNDGWDTQAPGMHNFHFTTEVQYWFQYQDDMNATLSFLGDDDVWVFINNRLAVDLGGLHVPREGFVTIDGTSLITHDFTNNTTGDTTETTTRTAASFGLQDGNVYSIKVFQAERHVVGSSFKLTLAGFDSSRSDCQSQCGDSIIGAGEECDDGVNDGGYNECQPGCVLGGYCGDGITQEGEDCDDGDPNKPAGCSGCRILVVK